MARMSSALDSFRSLPRFSSSYKNASCITWRAAVGLGALILFILVPLPAGAQSAPSIGIQATIPFPSGTNPVGPSGVAVDQSGDLFITDYYNSRVVEVPVGCSSTSCEVTIQPSSSMEPAGVALNSSGVLFIADVAGTVWEVPAGCTSGACATTVVTGLHGPTGVAIDSNGDLFVADNLGGRVLEIPWTGSSWGTQVIVENWLIGPYGLAIDASNDLFISDYTGEDVIELSASCVSEEEGTAGANLGCQVLVASVSSWSGHPKGIALDGSGDVFLAAYSGTVPSVLVAEVPVGSYGCSTTACLTGIGYGLNQPAGVAIDAAGDVIITDRGNGRALKVRQNSFSFGAIAVGSTSTPATAYFNFNSSDTLNSTPYQVLTQGQPGLDFADAGGSTCAATTYSAGSACVVNFDLTPEFAGLVTGAITLTDNTNARIATAYISGIGSGPEVTFFTTPVATTNLGSGLSSPSGLALDRNKNIFVADTGNKAVDEFLAASSYSESILSTSLISPSDVAVDGAGNVFVADTGDNEVEELLAPAYTIANSLGGSFNFKSPDSVTVDGAGNIFVADTGNHAVEEIVAPAYTVVNTLNSSFTSPSAIATDANGNLFVADSTVGNVSELTAASSYATATSLITGLAQPTGLALDPSGNVYVADSGHSAVNEFLAASSYAKSTLSTGFTAPSGVALDAAGNVYVTAPGATQVGELELSTPPTFAFPTITQQSTTDTVDGPLSATVANNGNATLTFNLTGSDNPSLSTSNFTWDDLSSTCTQTTPSSSTAFTLAEGASCTLAVEFTPTATGTLTDNLSLTDNALNATAATQQIPLSGTAVDITMTPAANTALPPGTVGTVYSGQTFAASGGSGSYTYSATGLPGGLTLDSSSGVLSGTPTAVANSASVTVTVTDSSTSVQISQNYTLTISQGTVTLNWAPPSSITYGADLSTVLTATASVDGTTEPPSFGTATYTASLNPSGTPFAVNSLTALDAGSYTLTLSYTPSDTTDYTTPAQIQQSLTINQASQTITITMMAPATEVYNGTFAVAATSSSELTVALTVDVGSTGVCSLSGGTVTMTSGTGTCTIDANQSGNTNYSAATQAQTSATATKAAPTVSWGTAPPLSAVYNSQFTVVATSNSTGAITFAASGACSVDMNSGLVTMTSGTGTCSVSASVATDANYTAGSVGPTSVTAALADQATLTVNVSSPATYGTLQTLSTTGGNGTGAVTYSAGASTACSVLDATLTIIAGTGTCSVTATKAADTNYDSATSVAATVTAQPAIAIVNSSPTASAITYGQMLSESTLTGGSATPSDGSFEWTTPTAVPLAGTQSESVVFVPNDTADYSSSVPSTISVTVTPANFVVTVSSDDAGTASNCTPQTTPGTGTDGSCSLRDALLETTAAGGGNISFDSNAFATATTITLTNGVLSIPSATTITGPTTGSGATLANLVTVSGNNASQVFNVGSGAVGVAIANLVVTNGYNNGSNGGGIYDGGQLTLTNCTLSNNIEPYAGGVNFGGAIFGDAGSTLTISNCTFSGNSGSTGGAIFANGPLTVSNSTFVNNSTGGGGGAIVLNGAAATGAITESTFSGNSAGDGGAIHSASSGGLTVTNSTFASNTAHGGLGASGWGGAIVSPGPTGLLTANNNIFEGNSAVAGGAGIYTEPGGTANASYNVDWNNLTSGSEDDCYNCTANTNAISASSDPVAALGNYGGPTQTLIPEPGSAAICAGSAALIPNGVTTDQRGLPNSNASYPNYSTCVDAGAVQTNYAMSFTTQPTGVSVATDFAAAVTLTESGTPFQPGVTIPLTLTGSGTLTGGSSTTASGVASYTLQVNTAGSNDTLSANLTLNGGLAPPVAISAASNTFDVGMTTPTVGLSLSSNSITYGTLETFTATVPSAATGSVTFYNNGTTVMGMGTVSGGTATFSSSALTAGSYSITAAYSGDSNYASATSSPQSLTINPADQATLTVTGMPGTPQTYQATFTVGASGGNGTGALTFAASGACSVDANSGLVTMTSGTGTCSVTATKAADTNYNSITSPAATVSAALASQTITITMMAPATEVYSGTFPVAATSSSGLAVALTVDAGSTGVCSLSGGTVTMTSGTGTCTIDANQSGNTNYSAATQAQTSATATKAAPTVIWSMAPPSSAVYNSEFTVVATSNSTGAITYSASGGCSNVLGVVTMTSGTGTCSVSASAAADANYTAGSVGPTSVTASQASQTITFTPPASPVTFGVTPITLSATATSGQAVIFTIDGSSTATGSISGDTLTITGAGTLIIDANQSGNSNYQAAGQVQQTILVNQALQIITFTPPSSPVTYGVSPVMLSASSSSALTVMFTIDPSSTATGNIAGNTLTINSAGTLVIDANQLGNTDFQAAAQVQSTIVVNPANFVVTLSTDDAGTASNCTPQTTPGHGTDASCSLRDVLLETAATGGGNISFDSNAFATATTITLTKGVLSIPSATTITGPTTGSGATLANLVTVDGNNASAVFTVSSGVTGASIANLTVQHGNNAGIQNAGVLTLTGDSITGNTASGAGGGIDNSGTLVLGASTISGNTAGGSGGGINNSGTLTLSDDTIANNNASGSAGGVDNSATLVVSDTTLSGNTAVTASGGGGIDNTGSGTVTLANSVLSGNTSNSAADDFDGTAFADNSGNIVGVTNGSAVNGTAIALAPLASYGGPTQTLIPLPGSPAICAGLAGSIPSGLTTDQRGLPNTNASYPSYSTCVDAGAVQTNYAMSFTTQPTGVSVATGFAAAVTLTESGSPFQPGVTIPLTLTGGGTLTGGSVTTANGVASYTLQVDTVGTGDALTANLTLNGGLAPPVAITAASNTFDVGMTTPAVTLSLSSASITYGTLETLTATVPSGATGTVNFYNIGSTLLGTGTVSGGVATFSSSTLAVGSYWITADYSGDSNYNSATSDGQLLTVNGIPATITSPTPGGTLTSATTTFSWTPGTGGVTGYYLHIGTTPGTGDLANMDVGTNLSATVTLPTNGAEIYVELETHFGSTIVENDNTYYEVAQSGGVITSPSPGSTLTSATTTFSWTPGTSGVTGYYLHIGTSPGTGDLVNMSVGTNLSATVTLPTNGAEIYVELETHFGSTIVENDNTYYEVAQSGGVITSPSPGSTLTSATTTFSWTAGTGGVTGYYLHIGTSPGTGDLVNMGVGTDTSATVTLPTNGATIYVQLETHFGSTIVENDNTYYEFAQSGGVITSPSPGSTLTSATTTFSWTPGTSGVTGYYLHIGTSPGTGDLANMSVGTNLSATVTLPTNGAEIYVELETHFGSTIVENDNTYYEVAQSGGVITSPTPGGTLTSATTTFSWTPGTGGVTGYYLHIGTTPGTGDLVNMGVGTDTSATVTLPTNGAEIYVQLETHFGSTVVENDNTYYEFAQSGGVITSPSPGSTLTSATTTFSWTPGTSGVTGYYLHIGTSPGTGDLVNMGVGTDTSATVTLPTDGATIYVQLETHFGSTIVENDNTYIDYTQ